MTETRTRPAPKAAVTLTPAAEARIADLMAEAPDGAIGVKLSTPRRGCSGLAYSVDYVTEEAKFDEKRSDEHTSELQPLLRIQYAVFCLKKNKNYNIQLTS